MKALKILKAHRQPDGHGYTSPVMVKKSYLLEAISELEAMQKHVAELEAPKSCDGCKWEEISDESSVEWILYCKECSRRHYDNYEPKDNK